MADPKARPEYGYTPQFDEYGRPVSKDKMNFDKYTNKYTIKTPAIESGSWFSGIGDGFTGNGYSNLSPTERMGLSNYGTSQAEFNAMNQQGQSDLLGFSGAGGEGGFTQPSAIDQNTFVKTELLDQQVKDNNSFDWGGAANVGLGALSAGMGISSFFDNKKMNSKIMDVADNNIRLANEARQDRVDFKKNTKSAFA